MVIRQHASEHMFRVYLPEARSVELVGAFTDWRAGAIRMIREETGWWMAKVDLGPGDHDFSYLVNGSVWLPDYAASGVKRNSFGGWVSQIHVSEVSASTVHVRSSSPRAMAA